MIIRFRDFLSAFPFLLNLFSMPDASLKTILVVKNNVTNDDTRGLRIIVLTHREQ